jgi:hypothetical protein
MASIHEVATAHRFCMIVIIKIAKVSELRMEEGRA